MLNDKNSRAILKLDLKVKVTSCFSDYVASLQTAETHSDIQRDTLKKTDNLSGYGNGRWEVRDGTVDSLCDPLPPGNITGHGPNPVRFRSNR